MTPGWLVPRKKCVLVALQFRSDFTLFINKRYSFGTVGLLYMK